MSQICSKMVIFLFSAFFGGQFCYFSNRKSRINTRPLHFGYCSNKLIIRNLWRATLFFDLMGGQKSLLMHVSLWEVQAEFGGTDIRNIAQIVHEGI